MKYLWNMKFFFLALFFTDSLCVVAQDNADTLITFYDLHGTVNVTVSLLDKISITGDVWKFNDSSLMLYGMNNAGIMELKNISYAQMRTVKIRRYAFAKGFMAASDVGGWFNDQIVNNSYADYHSSAAKALLQGVAVQASAALIGGLFNSAVKRKKFTINGKKQRFQKIYAILLQAQK